MPTLPDDPPQPSTTSLNLIDTGPPPVTDEQRLHAHRASFSWRGMPLQPWSLMREVLWREHRVTTDAPPLASYQTTADFLPEAIRILWISHLPDELIDRVRALPAESQRALCDAWRDKHITLAEAEQAATIGAAIWEAVQLARTTPVDTPDLDGLGESPRPLTMPPSSANSRAPQAGTSTSSATGFHFSAPSATSTPPARAKAARKRGSSLKRRV